MSAVPTTKAKQRRYMDELIQLQRFGLAATAATGQRYFEQVLDGLMVLRQQMANRTKGGRGRIVSDPVTPAKIEEVHRLRREHPDFSQQEIAYRTNVNIGRVSEILNGKRS